MGDQGYRGRNWAEHWLRDYGVRVLTKAVYAAGERDARRWLSRLRQVVETVNGWLEERLGLHFPRARTAWGLQARLAAKLAAFNLAIYFNSLCGKSDRFTAPPLWASVR